MSTIRTCLGITIEELKLPSVCHGLHQARQVTVAVIKTEAPDFTTPPLLQTKASNVDATQLLPGATAVSITQNRTA
jgi:hypothetical protein